MSTIPNTLAKFLWHFSKRYKFNLIGLVLVAVYSAVHMALSPYMLKLIIDRVSDVSAHPENLYQAVRFPAFMYVFLAFFLGVVYRFYDWMIIRTFPNMKGEITAEMYDYIQRHSYSYFQQNFAGSLANKINDLTKNTETIIINLIDHFLARTVYLIIGAGMMFLVHPYFSAVLIVWGAIFITSSILLSKKTQKYSEAFSETRSAVLGKIVDSISNILNVKLFSRERYENQYLKGYLTDSTQKNKELHFYLLRVKTFQAIAITILIASMTSLLIYARSHNMVTVGDFALILSLSMVTVDEIFYVANELSTFSEELGKCTQALSIISPKHELVDQPDATPLKVTKGEIEFDKVHFRYDKGHDIFSDKSIIIHPGEKVGLVGSSGSGKSTFVNLILRFFEIDSGQIRIDGHDVKKATQESLRNQIGLIPQDPVLFHRSLMENIRYGRLDATDEEVIESSKKAHCHEFILNLKDGYHSLVGERGVKLSGGQRQRIAIARAILKNAPILILDEATSSLDSVTENYIQESLALLMKDKTTIVIAHRLSTLFHMDRILVFNNGRIVEEGSHSELINTEGHYAQLWNMQAGGFLNSQKNLPNFHFLSLPSE